MNISVIGCGYLGAVHAAAMAELGHDVVAYDIDTAHIDQLALAKAPFHEPDLDPLLLAHVSSGRLRFTTDPTALYGQQVHFLCVGTPQSPSGYAADLRYVNAAIDTLTRGIGPDSVVVGKSTVPVGTAARLQSQLAARRPGTHLVWNPEFLREGYAVADTLNPDRLVYGIDQPNDPAHPGVAALDEVYRQILDRQTPRLITDYATAELVKVAANSFLATKISFINAMAEMCEAVGADVTTLAEAIGHDERIGPKFLRAGVGFGGGCLPKDIRAFMARAGELGAEQSVAFLREIDSINLRRRQHVVNLAIHALQGRVPGRRVTVLGAAFKPLSDDLRDSPALDVGSRLAGLGAKVRFVDPAANDRLRQQRPDLSVCDDIDEAVTDAEVVLLLTEWQQFVDLDPFAVGELVTNRWIIDGRNALDPQRWREAGWTYTGLGRP